MEQTKYDVFISYSRKDYLDDQKNVIPDNAVTKIMEALRTADISYWFDEEGIYSGYEFTEKIVTNIEASTIFLFLSTRNSNSSPWTSKEIACADELHKYIIPVRIDRSTYNKKVLFRIADRSYIDFAANPDKGLSEIVQSVKLYKEQLIAEQQEKEKEERLRKEMELKKAEEQKLKKEQDEKRRKQEQEKIVSDIKLSCTALNNEEAKIELDRDTLLLKTEQVADEKQRIQLIELIKNGGTIHKKYQDIFSKLNNEIQVLKSTDIESLKSELNDKTEKISTLELDLIASKAREKEQEKSTDRLIGQIGDLQKQIKDLHGDTCGRGIKNYIFKGSKVVHVTYCGIIACILICAVVWLTNVYKNSEYWEYHYNQTWDELRESKKNQEILTSLSNYIPFVITDIEVKNDDDEWGNKIYSSKSTYFIPRIKYIGLKKGKYTLYVKIFDSNGELSRNEETSPKGYSYSDELTIIEGENVSDQIIGWGNKTPGNWSAGNYRIEIWHKEKKLSEKTFRVY